MATIELERIGIRDLFDETYSEGRSVRRVIGREFYSPQTNGGIAKAVKDSLNDGFRPKTLPEISDSMISSSFDSNIWRTNWDSLSILIQGYDNYRDRVFVYTHLPDHYLTYPTNIREAINDLRGGTMVFPRKEFLEILEMNGITDKEGNRLVWVVYSEELRQWPSGVYGIREPVPWHKERYDGEIDSKEMIAINHPAIIPAFGSREKAAVFLARYKRFCDVRNRNSWFRIEHPNTQDPEEHITRVYLSDFSDLVNELREYYYNPQASFLSISEDGICFRSDIYYGGKILGTQAVPND